MRTNKLNAVLLLIDYLMRKTKYHFFVSAIHYLHILLKFGFNASLFVKLQYKCKARI